MRQIVGKRLTWGRLTGKETESPRALTAKEAERQKRGKRKVSWPYGWLAFLFLVCSVCTDWEGAPI
jgi:hypothetical protein